MKKIKTWWKLLTERCEHCHGKLRKTIESGYGGIDVNINCGGTKKETYYVCNLCYHLSKQK